MYRFEDALKNKKITSSKIQSSDQFFSCDMERSMKECMANSHWWCYALQWSYNCINPLTRVYQFCTPCSAKWIDFVDRLTDVCLLREFTLLFFFFTREFTLLIRVSFYLFAFMAFCIDIPYKFFFNVFMHLHFMRYANFVITQHKRSFRSFNWSIKYLVSALLIFSI